MTAPDPAWTPDDPGHDRHWTAFRYIAGELPPAEAADFEATLAVDQEAREAVAAAVELAGAVALLGPEAIPLRTPRRFARVAGWVATGIAAGLALGFGFDRLVVHRPAPAPPRVAEAVVATWSDLRAEPDDLAGQLALNDDGDLAALPEPDGDGDVPSWMAELATLPSPDTTPRREN